MGKKGGSRHLKRNPAPRFWPVHRKEYVWAVKPKPGPHSMTHSLPLTTVVRDILGFAETRKEAKTVIAQGKLLVNGEIRKEEAFPVGLMDVLIIPEAKASYRVLPHRKGLILHSIEKDEAAFRLCRIENKTIADRGHIQLNLHDGTNRLIKVADAKNPIEDVFKSLNVIRVSIPSGEMIEQVELEKGATALITGGKNRGTCGRVVDIEEAQDKERRSLLATIEDETGKRCQTILDYIFVLGSGEQTISLPEVK